MPIVNYVREHERFIEYSADEHLSASEQLVWYALFHIINQRAQGNVWPDEFIRISNDRLLSFCPMKFDTMAAARNGLKQRGLIEVIPGEKNKHSPAYRMIYFYPTYAPPETERDGEFYPKNSDYIGGNMGGNLGGNMGGNLGGNMGDIYINNTDRIRSSTEKGEEDEDSTTIKYARAREAVARIWKECYGKDPNPHLVNVLSKIMINKEMEPAVMQAAVEMACLKNPDSPFDFIITLLVDWESHGIKTEDDLDEYQYLYDAAKHGKTLQERWDAEEEMHQLEVVHTNQERAKLLGNEDVAI